MCIRDDAVAAKLRADLDQADDPAFVPAPPNCPLCPGIPMLTDARARRELSTTLYDVRIYHCRGANGDACGWHGDPQRCRLACGAERRSAAAKQADLRTFPHPRSADEDTYRSTPPGPDGTDDGQGPTA